MRTPRSLAATAAAAIAAATLAAGPAGADHTWDGYHWARTINPFTLQVGNNAGSPWQTSYRATVSDWTKSSVLDLVGVTGGTTPKSCRPTRGRVEICTSKYGNTDWLGIAQVWLTSGGHIAQGIVKNNDTWFNTARYNTPEWRQFVMCQEVGHTLGLDHQDENHTNTNLGSCLDYTNSPETNQHPNGHDYDQLESLYTHSDSTTTVAASAASAAPAAGAANSQAEWGQAVRYAEGRPILFERVLANGERVITFVIWAR